MGRKKKKFSSGSVLESARKKEEAQREIKEKEQEVKKAEEALNQINKKSMWIMSVFLPLAPIVIAFLVAFFRKNKYIFINFHKDFVNSGSFVWLSVSLLTTSLFELSLYGPKEQFAKNVSIRKKLIVAIVLDIVLAVFYVLNVESQLDEKMLGIVSYAGYILYYIVSKKISFKLVKN